MHRTEPTLKFSQPPAENTAFCVESALFSTPDRDTTCALFGPLHYEPGYGYPLIVWLHGGGDDERQLLRIMPQVSMRNYVAVAPRGIRLAGAGSPGGDGYGWNQTDESIRQAEACGFEGIEVAARKFHVARRKVLLAGFNDGGTMALRMAMTHPHRFAGVASFCGAFPDGRTPLGQLADVRQLPILMAVGRDSREYPPAAVCKNLRLFHTAGLSVTLRQYPCGHELCRQMLVDVDRWAIDQITPA